MKHQPPLPPTSTPGGKQQGRLRTARYSRPAAVGLAAAVALTAAAAAPAKAALPPQVTSTATHTTTSGTADPPSTGDVVTPDPSYQGPKFEGWGTSLVWFANATGDYPDEIKNKLADLVFGKDGLNLNIARYNIGGGNAPDVKDYLRPGGAVPGWWKAPTGTTRADTDWFDANNPADYNFAADPNQRWWVDRIKKNVTKWETFSNSPPWFMTESGYTSGGFDANKDQLKTDSIDSFSTYLTKVTRHLEKAHHIKVDTIDPFNEPNTDYWSTTLNAKGEPTGGRQEGAHMSPQLQDRVIGSLQSTLKREHSRAKISGPDETNPSTFINDVTGWSAPSVAAVSQLNVHTYGTGQRTAARDLAKGTGKPLWMSEVEGSWGDGQSFTDMAPGLGMAKHMTDDLRELEPQAWVFWQPVEDYDNMKPGGESEKGANWGSIQLPFNCTAQDDLSSCPIHTNQKFNTVRNFTHYIKPGDHLVQTDNPNATAAVRNHAASASVVYTNEDSTAKPVTLDLSKFGHVRRGATVTPVVTSAKGALKRGKPVRVSGDSVTVTVPAESVTTLQIQGVSGVDRAAPVLKEGHVYSLTGVQSGKLATVSDSKVTIQQAGGKKATQLFTFHRVARGTSTNRDRYEIRPVSTKPRLRLAARDSELVVEKASARRDREAQWVFSSTGDGKYSITNAGQSVNMEVGGEATESGSPVTLWQPNSGSNQAWTLKDLTVKSKPKIQK